jgi:hypothetical protein
MPSTPPRADPRPGGRSRRLLIALAVVVVVVGGAAAGLGLRARSAASTSPQGSAGAVVVAAAGDVACDPDDPGFAAGTGTPAVCHQKATSDLVLRLAPQAVLALGDLQYVHADLQKFATSYDPTWGRFKDITHPTIGNHEGGEGGSNKAYFDYFGAAAGGPDKGYYSYDLGAWHLIALNSNCGTYSFNGSNTGCAAGSTQDKWLRADLAAHPAACTLAYFHVPRFSSGAGHHSSAGSDRTLTTLWNDLYAAHTDLVLNGHAHDYERFAPMAPDGTMDPAGGIREFIVGTGGDNHHRFATTVLGSEVRNGTDFGVLRLTLRADGYDWQFLPDDGGPAVDSGAESCHGR